jgi:glycosyltransferase involved in cell wall biosynthesis
VNVSVVLIARNQERTIAPLIESVLRETAELESCELILVDSGSSDRTVEIARGYPVSVLGLPDKEWLSAAAGRSAGFARTAGANVLFLDGDMELCQGWLADALSALSLVPAAAAVAGRVIDSERGVDELPDHPLGLREVGGQRAWALPHTGGAAVYRRAALEQVGQFNPYLRSDEEPELALRLRARGWEILALDRPSVIHRQPVSAGLSALLARRRRGLFLGSGQVVRARLGRPGFRLLLRERGYFLAPLAVVSAGAGATLASLLTHRRRWIGAWAILVAGALAADVARRRSAKATALAAFNRLLFIEGLVKGFAQGAGDPAAHPVTTQQFWWHHAGAERTVRSPGR